MADLFEQAGIKPSAKEPNFTDLYQQAGIQPAVGPEQIGGPIDKFGQWDMLGGGMTGDPEMDRRTADSFFKMLGSAAMGPETVAAGLAQTAADGLAKVGVVDPAFRDAMTRAQLSLQKKAGEGTPEYSLGNFVGEGLTYLFAPGAQVSRIAQSLKAAGTFIPRLIASSLGGAVIGGTQFEEGDDYSRFNEALKGAGAGAAGEAMTKPLRYFGTKMINSSFVRDYLNKVKDFAADFNENSKVLPTIFQKEWQRREGVKRDLFTQRDRLGDRSFPVVDTTATVGDLQAIKDEAERRFGPKAGTVQTAIDKAIEQLSLPAIKVGGTAVSPGSPLYAAVMAKGGVTPVNYSRITGVARDLNDLLQQAQGSRELPSEAVKLLEKAKDRVDGQIAALEAKGPAELKRAADRADTYSKDTVLPFTSKEFDPARLAEEGGTGPTMFEANMKLIDIAVGEDTTKAQKLYGSLPAIGRREVQKGIVYRGIEESTVGSTGKIDPAKFAAFVKDLPTKDIFFRDPRGRAALDGIVNLVSEDALERGSVAAGKEGFKGRYQELAGVRQLMKGQFGAAGLDMASAWGFVTTLTGLRRVMNTEGGLAFSAAASKVKPGSPEMARLYNQFLLRFGALPAASPDVRNAVGEVGSTAGDVLGSTFQ